MSHREKNPVARYRYYYLRCYLFACYILFLSVLSQAQVSGSPEVHNIHYRPDGTKAGDVIPYFWKGVYHIFYLRNNDWAHITSKDMVHWEALPDALLKDTASFAPDGEGCWTGSIVEHNGIFHLFYTGKNSRDPKGDQKVMKAISTDLIHWTKKKELTFYADGAVYWSKPVNGAIDDKQIYHHQAFRDPAVSWNAAEKKWWMILHAMLADGSSPAMGLYTSTDLEHWQVDTPLVVYPKSISGDCPDLFSSEGKWFIYCADYHYMKADEARGPYNTAVNAYDCGDLRVPKMIWDGKRWLLMGWICDYDGRRDEGKTEWGGTLCMPREVYTDASGNMLQRPLAEIVQAFTQLEVKPKKGKPGIAVDVPQDFMYHTTVDAQPGSSVQLYFGNGEDTVHSTYKLLLDTKTKDVTLGSRYKTYTRNCPLLSSTKIDIRLFVVDDVIECFINNAYCFTIRSYNRTAGKLSVYVSGSIKNYELSVPVK